MEDLCALLIIALMALTVFLKFVMTLLNFKTIELAIFKYEIIQMTKGEYNANDTLYKYMRSMAMIFINPFDWGYKHILPPDKYELVKPYLGREE